MAQLGSPQPGLPNPPSPNFPSISAWASAMVRTLSSILSSIIANLNRQPFCPTFTVATRPDVAEWKGRIIFVSDGGAGAVFQGSNGAAWVNLG